MFVTNVSSFVFSVCYSKSNRLNFKLYIPTFQLPTFYQICPTLYYFHIKRFLLASSHRRQESFVLSRPSFDQFCLVRVGGVNTIEDAAKLSCLVELAV